MTAVYRLRRILSRPTQREDVEETHADVPLR